MTRACNYMIQVPVLVLLSTVSYRYCSKTQGGGGRDTRTNRATHTERGPGPSKTARRHNPQHRPEQRPKHTRAGRARINQPPGNPSTGRDHTRPRNRNNQPTNPGRDPSSQPAGATRGPPAPRSPGTRNRPYQPKRPVLYGCTGTVLLLLTVCTIQSCSYSCRAAPSALLVPVHARIILQVCEFGPGIGVTVYR